MPHKWYLEPQSRNAAAEGVEMTASPDKITFLSDSGSDGETVQCWTCVKSHDAKRRKLYLEAENLPSWVQEGDYVYATKLNDDGSIDKEIIDGEIRKISPEELPGDRDDGFKLVCKR